MKLPNQPMLPGQSKNPHQSDDFLPSPIPAPLQNHEVQILQNQVTFAKGYAHRQNHYRNHRQIQ